MYKHTLNQRHEQLFRAGRCVSRNLVNTANIVTGAAPPQLPTATECGKPEWAKMSRRFPGHVPWPSLISVVRPIGHAPGTLRSPRDISREQLRWRSYCRDVRNLCSTKFWEFFLPMHTFSRSAIDTALRCVRNTFGSCHQFKSFPTTTRTLFLKMREKVSECVLMHICMYPYFLTRASSCAHTCVLTHNCECPRACVYVSLLLDVCVLMQVEPFWLHVMHSTTIDLSSFKNVPSHKRSLTFEFVDPVWAWVQSACEQPAQEMQWVPMKQHLRDDDEEHPYYGGGLQYGEAFTQACRTCPGGTYPMCISLHWDGTSAHGLSATPIAIGVANTNSASASTQFCIGYMPVLSDLGANFGSEEYTEIKFYIRNQCVAAILRVLETAARTGVRCRLPSTDGGEEEMFLMPRLFSMNIDQPEAQLYFGMLNRT